jgi:heme exporter protein D
MTELENPPMESAKRTTKWPADYYSAPTSTPVLPQWVPFGCGGLALIVLIVVFAGGAFLASGGFTDFMDFAIGMSVSEMQGQYAPDVSATRKKSLDDEIVRLRRNLREQTITIVGMQPFFEHLREATSDKKVTGQEAQALEEIARKVNAGAKPKQTAK